MPKKSKIFGTLETKMTETEEVTTTMENTTESLGTEPLDSEVSVELNNKAIGCFYNTTTNSYHLVEICYNPETSEIGNYRVLDEVAHDRNTINEAFKINVIRAGILG